MATPTILDSFTGSLMHNLEVGTSLSFTYTVPGGGANTMLVVVSTQTTGNAPTAISQNGVDLTGSIVKWTGAPVSPGFEIAGHFYAFLAAPTTGTFSITWGGTTSANVSVFTLRDCAQVSPDDVFAGAGKNPSSGSITKSFTTNVGNDIIISSTTVNPITATVSSFGSGETLVTSGSSVSSNNKAVISWKPAASTGGSESMTTNFSGDSGSDIAIVAFKYQAPSTVNGNFLAFM